MVPFKKRISKALNPTRGFDAGGRGLSIKEAKKAVSDYKKSIGRELGMAELLTYCCEEGFRFITLKIKGDSFLESYEDGLINFIKQTVEIIDTLPTDEQIDFKDRLITLHKHPTDESTYISECLYHQLKIRNWVARESWDDPEHHAELERRMREMGL